MPSTAEWLHATRISVVMDTTRAKTDLGWTPCYSSGETLDALAASF